MDLSQLPIETVILTGISAWALTEWMRPLLNVFGLEGPQRKLALRSLALIVGALVGAIIHPDLVPTSSSQHGAVIGLCCGSLNALIVSKIKRKVEGSNE